jgi:hypothetical protein
MGDDGNAARRDAGAREPAWDFETDPRLDSVGDLGNVGASRWKIVWLPAGCRRSV